MEIKGLDFHLSVKKRGCGASVMSTLSQNAMVKPLQNPGQSGFPFLLVAVI